MAIEANFFEGLVPALTGLIYDKDLLVGYVTKEGPLLSANEFDSHLIPRDFFRILKNRIKEREYNLGERKRRGDNYFTKKHKITCG